MYSNSEKLREITEKKELHGFPLKGSSYNVENSNVQQRLLQKIDQRYQDLHDDVLEATTIGSLKNWPSDNDEGKSKMPMIMHFFYCYLSLFLLHFCLFDILFVSLLIFLFSIFCLLKKADVMYGEPLF
jgi:hypothetical protein